MVRIFQFLFAAAVAAGAVAQDLSPRPNLAATLSVPSTVVSSGSAVEFVLLLEVTGDATVPAAVLTGTMLEVTVDDKPRPPISEAGKGGDVHLTAGTRVERRIRVPAARFAENASDTAFHVVAVKWPGLPGANCVFKIFPDSSKLDLAKLDHAKTTVVLVTSHGEMTLSFRPDKAPKHVENFLKLAQSGYYDGMKFHRVMRGFMIQCGDPYSRDESKRHLWGTGGSGEKLAAEFNDMRHVRGTLSMARGSHDVNSATSQFFIVHKDAPGLDGNYTAFGSLEAGADTLDAIANVPCGGPKRETPISAPILYAAVILPVAR